MKIPGGSPFRQIRQNTKTSKASKTKKGKAKSAIAGTQQAQEVNETEASESTEALDSPIYDVMAEASAKFKNGESDLEEATRTVVSAMLYEHFGKKNVSEKTLAELTQTVSDSINNNKELGGRLESILRRVHNYKKKTPSKNKE